MQIDLRGGRSAMVVPTATAEKRQGRKPTEEEVQTLLKQICDW
jgi:hypothetical protein